MSKVIIRMNRRLSALASDLLKPSDLPPEAREQFKSFEKLVSKIGGPSRATVTIVDDEDGSEDSGIYHFHATWHATALLPVANFAALGEEFSDATISVSGGKVEVYYQLML